MTLEAETERQDQVLDGRYLGMGTRYWLELRIDLKRRMISGDLQSVGSIPPTAVAQSPARVAPFSASFRSVHTCQESPARITWTAPDGEADGTISWTASSAITGGLEVTLALSKASGSQPPDTTIEMTVVRTGDALRVLGLEIEEEDGAVLPQHVTVPEPVYNGLESVGVEDCLGEAGIAVGRVGQSTPISKRPEGWTESDIFAQLDRLMRTTAQADVDVSAFEIHLLVLSRTDRDRLCGLAFDVGSLPRQGVAVFVDTIKRISTKDRADRKIVATAMHEIGHALNLVHRFDRTVRQSTSTSFMNYDWRYRGGTGQNFADPAANASRFWGDFKFTFDDDELRHLRHAGRAEIIPGGAAFGSVRYWDRDLRDEGFADPNEPWRRLRLWLTPPKAGTTFAFGQTVFVTVSLTNIGDKAVAIPRHLLDVKAGQLQLMIRPWNSTEIGASQRLAESSPIIPIMRRCFEVASDWPAASFHLPGAEPWRSTPGIIGLGPGESIHTNANLVYGASEFSVDPGEYEVTPYLSFPPGPDDEGLDQIVVGQPLRIRVRPPQSRTEEQDAEMLLRPDVVASLALGGSTCLQAAADDLEDLRARRQHANRSGAPDPVVAVLTRAAGIHEGRQGNTRIAAWLLEQATTRDAATAFDPHTAEHTRRLAERYSRHERLPNPIPVVVDLCTRAKAEGGATARVRVPGFLVVQEAAQRTPEATHPPGKGIGWGVLAPATQFPKEMLDRDHDVVAEVTVAPGDGLTQRIAVNRIDLATSGGGAEGRSPELLLAVLALANPIPADRRVPLDETVAPVPRPAAPPADMSSFFDRVHPTPESWPDQDKLADFAAAADESLADLGPAADGSVADAPAPIEPTVARIHTYPNAIDDVANWFCDATPICEPPPPPADVDEPRTKPVVSGSKATKPPSETPNESAT